jgi:diketogulonate reductase-like aldo/keto reductase
MSELYWSNLTERGASGMLLRMKTSVPGGIRTVALPDGVHVPALGLGTWEMGERERDHDAEVAALRAGLDLGMTLVDTAEMYGDGGAEVRIAEATAGRRDDVFLVSKVYPHNAGRRSMAAACERSLQRLATDRLDLYLLHWRGRIPLAETVDAFERLRRDGKIVRWGVSNFDVDDMEELSALPDGRHCTTNQVLYNLAERGIEWRLAAFCHSRGLPIMAYSPLGRGDLLRSRKLSAIARDAGATPAQLALAWVLGRQNAIAIPKASNISHVRENRRAADLALSAATMSALERAFPPPTRATPLAVI